MKGKRTETAISYIRGKHRPGRRRRPRPWSHGIGEPAPMPIRAVHGSRPLHTVYAGGARRGPHHQSEKAPGAVAGAPGSLGDSAHDARALCRPSQEQAPRGQGVFVPREQGRCQRFPLHLCAL